MAGNLFKYISKTLSEDDYIPKGKKAYIASHGLKKPVEYYISDEDLVNMLTPERDRIETIYKAYYENEYVGNYDYYKLLLPKKGGSSHGGVQR